MNVVLFSPHFPSNFCNFARGLKNVGANVLVIADIAYEDLHAVLRENTTEYYKVEDMHDYDQIVRACGYFTHKYGKIDRFESHNEYWLEQDASIRTDFNIFGIKCSEIDYYKKKSLMKEKFQKAGVRCPQGKVVTTSEDAVAWGQKIDYPVVVKPDIGVGASSTWRIDSEEELKDFFANKDGNTYIMEEYITGEITSFDGLVDKKGNLIFFTGHKYSEGIMDTVNNDTHVYYYSYRDMPKDLYEAGTNVVKNFDVRERFFHLEFFRKPSGELIALEVNMRPPGGLTIDMFNYASNIDIYEEWARVLVKDEVKPLSENRIYHCAYVGRKNRYNYTYSHQAIMDKYYDQIAYHEQISSIFGAALGNYGYLVRTTNEPDLMRIIDYIHDHSE